MRQHSFSLKRFCRDFGGAPVEQKQYDQVFIPLQTLVPFTEFFCRPMPYGITAICEHLIIFKKQKQVYISLVDNHGEACVIKRLHLWTGEATQLLNPLYLSKGALKAVTQRKYVEEITVLTDEQRFLLSDECFSQSFEPLAHRSGFFVWRQQLQNEERIMARFFDGSRLHETFFAARADVERSISERGGMKIVETEFFDPRLNHYPQEKWPGTTPHTLHFEGMQMQNLFDDILLDADEVDYLFEYMEADGDLLMKRNNSVRLTTGEVDKDYPPISPVIRRLVSIRSMLPYMRQTVEDFDENSRWMVSMDKHAAHLLSLDSSTKFIFATNKE